MTPRPGVRRRTAIRLVACGAVALAAATAATGAALASPGDEVALAPIVAAWPDAYTVSGAKSEPLYTEQIQVERDGDTFSARIDVLAQGDAAFGTQRSAVAVAPSGTVAWVDGCTKPVALCGDDTQLRGFLATAAVVALDRAGRLPATATRRAYAGAELVCVDDAALHPDAPAAVVRLDPCFDRQTGAVVAHWSAGSGAFVGATLAPGYRVITP